ncbi:DUF5309 domain-containing protein [Rhodococcus erythropolis]|uniref:SU10 major capsid protein n=1 Tax=Rhodococcus erythropolis TaxID=1833 RepID=UPI001C9B5116|nr:DUF5309 family protein [Rhodococcus erythropolis]MBY6385471.1 DUF5309 domain-containing protein [Rhodococcus erythropolis]
MSGITGLSTTFNLPNYHGELIAITPEDTPLLSATGGLGGGKQASSTSFEWQEFDLRDPQIRTRLEGADAPNPEARVRSNHDNVVQIFHEAVSTSYTKQAATEQYASNASGVSNPIANEHAWQVTQSLKQIARDVNYAFWHAKYNKPSDNTTARQTRGLLQAITSNKQYVGDATEIVGASAATDTITVTHALVADDKVVFTDVGASTAIVPNRAYWVKSVSTTASFKIAATKGGAAITVGTATVSFVPVKAAATLTPDLVGNLLQSVFENGGISEQGTATLFVAPGQKRAITRAYAASNVGAQQLVGTRNIGGLSVDTVITDFGTLNVAIDKALPADALVVLSLEQIDPVFLSIPGKGVLFEEELAKTGASEKTQIYGEIGLAYGNERSHGVLRGLFV